MRMCRGGAFEGLSSCGEWQEKNSIDFYKSVSADYWSWNVILYITPTNPLAHQHIKGAEALSKLSC